MMSDEIIMLIVLVIFVSSGVTIMNTSKNSATVAVKRIASEEKEFPDNPHSLRSLIEN
jgi:hypothetical protein